MSKQTVNSLERLLTLMPDEKKMPSWKEKRGQRKEEIIEALCKGVGGQRV